MRDFDRKEAYKRKDDYRAFGIDPEAKDARSQYRKAVTEEVYGSFGLEIPMEESKPEIEVMDAGPGTGNSPPTKAPGSSRSNPLIVGKDTPEPPPGTWVKLPPPDGRVILTR